MLLQEHLGKGLLAKFAHHYLHLILFLLVLIRLLFVSCLFFDRLNCSPEIFRSCFPVVRSLFKNFCFALNIFFLLLFLLLGNDGLLFVNQSFCFRIKLLSLAHKHQFACFGVLL